MTVLTNQAHAMQPHGQLQHAGPCREMDRQTYTSFAAVIAVCGEAVEDVTSCYPGSWFLTPSLLHGSYCVNTYLWREGGGRRGRGRRGREGGEGEEGEGGEGEEGGREEWEGEEKGGSRSDRFSECCLHRWLGSGQE